MLENTIKNTIERDRGVPNVLDLASLYSNPSGMQDIEISTPLGVIPATVSIEEDSAIRLRVNDSEFVLNPFTVESIRFPIKLQIVIDGQPIALTPNWMPFNKQLTVIAQVEGQNDLVAA